MPGGGPPPGPGPGPPMCIMPGGGPGKEDAAPPPGGPEKAGGGPPMPCVRGSPVTVRSWLREVALAAPKAYLAGRKPPRRRKLLRCNAGSEI